MNKRNTKRGFTITELIIVIVVIAILAAVLIPTFVSLINKANQSADIQAVRQMNTVLKTDEAINGKPASVTAMKAVLAAEGIVDLKPMYENNAFAWHNVDNVVILMDQETQKGVFPKEYKGDDYDAATWEIFGGTVNVAMGELGTNLDEALQNAKPGQTIVLAENQTLSTTMLAEDVSIDLNGKTLTATNGFDLAANANVELSNGTITSKRVDLYEGADLVLNNVNWTTTSSNAFYPRGDAASLEINGGTIIAPNVIATSYSDGNSQHITLNLTGVTFGSKESPCGVAMYVINASDVTVTNCTMYATDAAIVSRAGNTTVENTTIYYQPTAAYNDTYLTNAGSSDYGIYTPNGNATCTWSGGSGGMNAPIVIGDFYVKHYSYDANCVLTNVKVINETSYAYPDVYLSQENYDMLAWDAANNKYSDTVVAGTEQIVKTTLTCDSTITWAVNPGKNDSYASICTGIYEKFADEKYGGFKSFVTNGVALQYVDNVFVNGVEQAKGSTSANPVPAN